jgi:hypothetical protein
MSVYPALVNDGEDVVVSFSGVPNPTPQVRFVFYYVVLKLQFAIFALYICVHLTY